MMEFKIYKDVCLGFTCWGGAVDSCGESTLELTEEEVDSLVELIERKGTADMEELELEVALPEVYAKLDAACLQAARNAEEDHWLEYGWENPDCGFDYVSAMKLAEEEYGYKFEYKEEDFLDGDGVLDEDAVEEAQMEHFCEWLTEYKDSLNGEKKREFMRRFVDVDVENVDYEVEIPEDIVSMCDIDD